MKTGRPFSLHDAGLVLAACFLLLPMAESVNAAGADLLPFIEDYPDGRIDWDDGLIYGVGRGYLHLNRGDKNFAMRAARALAYQSILKVAAGVRLDDERTLKSLGDGPAKIHLKGLVSAKEYEQKFVEDVPQPYYEMTYVASLNGVDGLTTKLISTLKSKPLPWKQNFPKPSSSGPILENADDPWLLLDARNLPNNNKLDPALLPRILSSDGQELYSVATVDENALTQRGMASYVRSSADKDQLSWEESTFQRVLAGARDLLSVPEARAAEKRERTKRQKFVVKEVEDVQGLAKTNLIISKNDVADLQAEDASSKILKQCRVVVIASSAIGGIEGRFRQFLLARQETKVRNSKI